MKRRNMVFTGLAVVVALGLGGAALYSATQTKKPLKSADQPLSATSTAKKTVDGDDVAPTTDTSDKTAYTNNRYGFNASSPVGWTVKASQNGDGATFTNAQAKDATIKVYGFSNPDLKPPDQIYAQLRSDIEGSSVTFEEVEKNSVLLDNHPATEVVWRFQSSVPGSTDVLFEKKMVFSLKGDAVCVLELTATGDVYPQYLSVFDQMVKEYKIK